MCKDSDIQSLMKNVTEQLEPIDVLVNNGGSLLHRMKGWSWMKRRGTRSSISTSRIQTIIRAAHALPDRLVQLRLNLI
jgi:NADP-dependent 3-hydroxy acid dehydrogenase YdfG